MPKVPTHCEAGLHSGRLCLTPCIMPVPVMQGQEYAGQLCVKQKEAAAWHQNYSIASQGKHSVWACCGKLFWSEEKSAAKQAVMAMANLHPPTSKACGTLRSAWTEPFFSGPKEEDEEARALVARPADHDTIRLSPNGLAAKKAKQAKDRKPT